MSQVVCSFYFHSIFVVQILRYKLKVQHTCGIDYLCVKNEDFLFFFYESHTHFACYERKKKRHKIQQRYMVEGKKVEQRQNREK